MIRSRIIFCLFLVTVGHKCDKLQYCTPEPPVVPGKPPSGFTEDVLFGDKTPIYTVSTDPLSPDGFKYELVSGIRVEGSWTMNTGPINTTTKFPPPGSNVQNFGKLSTTVYPEILLIVDYDAFKSHNFSLWETVRYYAAFMNGVDVKFSLLRKPKVRLNIAGIIIGLDRDATRYLELNRVYSNDAIYADDVVDDLSSELYYEERFPRYSYDVVMVITTSDLCDHEPEDCESYPVFGMGEIGSACDWNTDDERVNSIVLVRDNGFNGIAMATQQLGHVFGASDDGDKAPKEYRLPGARKCKSKDGYLMSSLKNRPTISKWSNCSRNSFRYFFNEKRAECLRNKPKNMGVPLPRLQPGELLSLDEQCSRSSGGKRCGKRETVCTFLRCRNGTDSCTAYAPAADGSPCGDDKICKIGECVKKTEEHYFYDL